ncbi:MAG: putative quinol monooxygenase [Actinomycetota bacterium]
MDRVARYGRAVAREGRGEELAAVLLQAAGALQEDPGCELYLVHREAGAPDTIWVTELWRSQRDLDAALARIRGSEGAAAAMTLATSWDMVELDLLGGKGPAGTVPV